MANEAIRLYERHFVENGFERLELFSLIRERFSVASALYPESFVHITPSFVFPSVTYVDTGRRATAFLAEVSVMDLIRDQKSYAGEPEVTFLEGDFEEPLGLADESFDLLISQYAGFVSVHCKRYLRINGLLLANNSHGDAGMTSTDDDYRLVAVADRSRGRHRLSEKNLVAHFIPKQNRDVTRDYLKGLNTGVGYAKSASAYVFERVA